MNYTSLDYMLFAGMGLWVYIIIFNVVKIVKETIRRRNNNNKL